MDKLEWRTDYLRAVLPYLEGTILFHGGRLCEYARAKGMYEPHHHNMWVGAVKMLERLGFIQRLGISDTPDTRQTHARDITLWRSKIAKADKLIQGELFPL